MDGIGKIALTATVQELACLLLKWICSRCSDTSNRHFGDYHSDWRSWLQFGVLEELPVDILQGLKELEDNRWLSSALDASRRTACDFTLTSNIG
jgi:hypothetical protein